MPKRTAQQQKQLRNLIKRCIQFAHRNGNNSYPPGGYHGYIPYGNKYEGRDLIITLRGFSSLGGSECTIRIWDKASRRVVLGAWIDEDSEPGNEKIKVSTYRPGDWKKKINRRMRA